MIDFLIKSTTCLVAFLVFYRLLLEKEKMHHFNRFYLLSSILLSLVIPFITFEIIKIIPIVQTIEPEIINATSLTYGENVIEKETNYIPFLLWSIYGLITLVLLIRFIKNVWKLISKSKTNPIVKFSNANLVLINEKSLPHTFLNFIFINFEDYNNQKIEDELLSHELVHVNQKHTLDVLFIELLRVLYWFNPLLYLYKKSILLNHEFLADEEVVKTYKNVQFYQNLLLQKSSGNQTIGLASNLNYLVTKKRLVMMTKNTSQKTTVLKKITVVPILAGLIYFLCFKIVAQEKVTNINSSDRALKITDKDKIRDSYYSGVYVKIIDEKTNRKSVTLYENLSLQDRRKYLDLIPEIYIEKEIPQPLFENLKSKNFKISINNRLINKEELKKYQRTNFSYYSYHIVDKSERTKQFPQEYQYTLYTKDYFNKNMKNSDVHFKGDTITIGYVSYKTAMKNLIARKIKSDTIVWTKEGKEGYNLFVNDSVKKHIRYKKLKSTDKIEIDIKKDTIKVKKLTDFDTTGRKSGYIYMNDATYFFVKDESNNVEYFNRWGFRVNEYGEKINNENNINVRPTTTVEIEKVNYDKELKSLDEFNTGTKKSGYIYFNNATYYFVKDAGNNVEYFNRWGFPVNNKGERLDKKTE